MSAASVRLREPLGGAADERRVGAPLRIGGEPDAAIRVPGVNGADAIVIDCVDGAWVASGLPPGAAQLNGEPLSGERELRDGDVLALGAARIRVALAGHEAPLLDVRHLAGNDTLPPLSPTRRAASLDDASDAEIVAAAVDFGDATRAAATRGGRGRERGKVWAALVAVALALVVVFGVIGRMQRVTIEVEPSAARVSSASLLSWYSGGALFVLPGEHRVRASATGYVPLERTLQVTADQPATLPLRLARQPGVLHIETKGVAARVLVDGADAGRAPGDITVAAGARTITLRAERHLDVVRVINVEGRGQRQEIALTLPPSWGRIALSVTTSGASVQVDGGALQPLPATLDLPAGVRHLRVSAAGARDWQSSVVVTAGQTTAIGPLTLGAPDAQLVLRSQPAGAAVTIDGVLRGRTPLQIGLPPGTGHDVALALAGHAAWQKRVEPAAGARLTLDAQLAAVMVPLEVRGEPADAELVIDDVPRGRTPLALSLLATRHRVEVRRAGSQTFATEVDLTPALARTLEFVLTPEGRGPGWKPPTEQLTTKSGQVLRLVPAGSFTMGSGRREQGRQPNETQRRVTLTRPFYLGLREVTNYEFRRFQAEHSSGFVDKRSVDLDAQAVTGVSWADAVAYCNWLSAQDGLPVAYEQKDGAWALKVPLTTGYRLPTEAEWEYAAGYAALGQQHRYSWGDALPVPPGTANLAGREATAALERQLDGWQDDYQSVAPPGKFAPGPLGLFDLTGNVSEWTHDLYASFADAAPASDPLGATTGTRHVVKGSNWRTSAFSELRVAWRIGSDAATQDLGFRIARIPE